jgi:hypothetical protein
MIGKIQKARQYAEEPERVTFESFTVSFEGNHDRYTITYDKGHSVCSHTMAMERLLGPMLKRETEQA